MERKFLDPCIALLLIEGLIESIISELSVAELRPETILKPTGLY